MCQQACSIIKFMPHIIKSLPPSTHRTLDDWNLPTHFADPSPHHLLVEVEQSFIRRGDAMIDCPACRGRVKLSLEAPDQPHRKLQHLPKPNMI